MPGTPTRDALRGIDELFRLGTLVGLTDGQLLGRFVAGPEEVAASAFAAIVERHGPMVLRACRRELGNGHDAEDAAQVAFLALARGARSIRSRESAAGWLLGVAVRVARRSRLVADRRRRLDRAAARSPVVPPGEGRSEVDAAVSEELARLADRYRDPLVLCHLEGLTQEQAAARLGLPLRTVQRRLTQGRDRLRDRLVRRGVVLSAGLIAAEAGAAVLPEGWTMTVVRAALPMARWGTRILLRSRLKVAATVLLAGLGALGLMPKAQGQKPPADPAVARPAEGAGRVLHIKVVADDTGKPIPGASVRIKFPDTHRDEPLKADDDGRVDFRHSTGPDDDWMRVEVGAEGYASQEEGPLGSEEKPIPDEVTFRLRPGIFLGGVVTDERGRPVPGATLHISVDERGGTGRRGPFDGLRLTTGPDGRWQTRSAPEFSEIRSVQVVHPDYSSNADFRAIPADDFRAGTAMLVVPKATPLEGRVFDADGRPVAGTRIVQAWPDKSGAGDGEPPHIMPDLWGTYSGESGPDGRFRLPRTENGGSRMLVASAPGHATTLIDIGVGPDAKPVEIRLGRPRPFRGRVIDTQGRPIAGVCVQHGHSDRLRLLIPSSWTDADGRFRIDDMADEPFFLYLGAKVGHLGRLGLRTNPSDDEVRFILNRALSIKGRVRDAGTGRGVALSEVKAGLVDPKTGSIQEDPRVFNHALGSMGYSIALDAEVTGPYRFRLTAEGYKPFVSREFKVDESEVTYDVTLERENAQAGPKALPIAVTVVGPDGKPVAGATVALAGDFISLAIVSEGKLAPSRKGDLRDPTPVATTGPDGRCSIPPMAPPAPGEPERPSFKDTMIVVHDRFFGMAALPKMGKATIKVEPWGRIEGTFKAVGRPTPGMLIGYVFARSGRSDMGPVVVGHGTTTTDAQGRFAFDRVVPGGVRIEQRIGAVRDPRGSVRGVFAFVKAGETAQVTLGGAGRVVVGRVVAPEGIDLGADPAAVTDVSVESDGPDPVAERKASLDGLNEEEKQKAFKRYEAIATYTTLDGLDVEESRRWWEALHLADADGRRWVRVGRAAIDRELRFRVDDLPPGPYRIKVAVRAGPGAEWSGRFQVPEPAAGKVDAPIDLGVIHPLPNRPPAASP